MLDYILGLRKSSKSNFGKKISGKEILHQPKQIEIKGIKWWITLLGDLELCRRVLSSKYLTEDRSTL